MVKYEETDEWGITGTQGGGDQQEAPVSCGGQNKTLLNLEGPIGVNVDSASFRPDAALFSTSQFELKNLLMSEQWHIPYAAALLETDPAKLRALITESENAIFTRYLELCVSSGSKEQVLDLERAVNTLSQLKKLNEAANP